MQAHFKAYFNRSYLLALKEIGLTSGTRVYSTLLSMVALALTARWLGPEGRGVGVVVITWASMISAVTYLSLGQVCIHRAARESNLDWLGPALSALLWITMAGSLVGWAACLLMYVTGMPASFGSLPPLALMLGFASLPFLIW